VGRTYPIDTELVDPGDRQRRYERRKSAERAEIGDIPAVKNPKRREKCRLDLNLFLVTYFPATTGLNPFSDDHDRIIARIQDCGINGGKFLNVVYRGFAKTTISENAALWAILYGHRRFVAIFGGGAKNADGNIDSLKQELSENDLLYEDFPEVCHAIRALEGKPQRCASQTYQGELTHIEWTADRIVLPSIPGSVASAGVISAHGITAASRGLKFKRPDGTQQRPDLAIIDDPQTDESAGSPIQISKRLAVIRKNICKLGGHARKIAVVINATVIEPNDLIDQLLDQKAHPGWQSQRIKMVRKWADVHETLWLEDYANLRNTYDPTQLGAQEIAWAAATKFYKRHRAEMDAGCEVSWKHCFEPDTEISAIQHAYNMLIDDGPEVFASEAQNEPLIPRQEKDLITAAAIAAMVNKVSRGTVPAGTQWLTGFIDVQGPLLYYLVLASRPGFTCSVVDYGTYPDQRREYFTLDDARITLAKQFPGAGQEAQILAALDGLTEKLLGKEWLTESGQPMRISLCGIDANWSKSTDIVYAFCRRHSRFAAQLIPCHGRGIGPAESPMSDWPKKEGDRKGLHWLISAGKTGRALRHVITDANWWKSFLYARLGIAVGDKGGLTLFGRAPHRMLADHWTSEHPTKTMGRGREVDVWKLRPGKKENHFLDCIVGALVMASILGCTIAEVVVPPRRRKRYASVNYLE
jgi:hypothetical protein